jgi:hypothetical protein
MPKAWTHPSTKLTLRVRLRQLKLLSVLNATEPPREGHVCRSVLPSFVGAVAGAVSSDVLLRGLTAERQVTFSCLALPCLALAAIGSGFSRFVQTGRRSHSKIERRIAQVLSAIGAFTTQRSPNSQTLSASLIRRLSRWDIKPIFS